jgi:hypothetical protein
MLSIDNLRLLDTVAIPEGLIVEVTNDSSEFMAQKATLNRSSTFWFGAAMKQGERLQFLTSMPVNDYLSVVKYTDRAKRGVTVEVLRKSSNRPKIESHQRDIKNYLTETACQGEKFIFPNFMVNYGSEWNEGMPKARLILLAADEETLSWPAIFVPPSGVKMPPTDGAHRTASLAEMIEHNGDPDGIRALLANGVGVTFVMEENRDDAHQDFADCGKSKPIAGSIVATWDKRNTIVTAARALVATNKFLGQFVDATSPSVNLSQNSAKVYSMSAVRGAIPSAIPGFENKSADEKVKALTGVVPQLSAYLDQAIAGIDILHQIAIGGAQPRDFRKGDRGGCVLLRGVGFFMLMRVFRHAVANGLDPLAAAAKLNPVDWFVLNPNAPPKPTAIDDVYDWLKAEAQPKWFKMLVVNHANGTFRIKGTAQNVEAAFGLLKTEVGL